MTDDQAVPLPADAIEAADTGDGVVIISCGEVPGLTLPVSTEAYEAFTAALIAQGEAVEREACAQLAEQHNARYQQACGDQNCPGHELAGAHTHHSVAIADLIRARTTP